ncbi:MAG: hypothetical protein KIT33_13495 [Candidatus Kapabacteria bacterium]|nr:hypothetical protein [Ignavibacteriota bacterium]MCW5885979.1 hypothetical protein [Candidatus Kapabacteria bacterium]
MNYKRLIHDYLDGELDGTGEEALFASLSGSSELRNEFNSQVKINNLAMMDMNRITVPPDITDSVFAQLGMAASGGAVLAATESGSFFRRYSGLLLLLLFLFTAGTSIYLLNENNSLKGILGSAISKKQSVPMIESYDSGNNQAENIGNMANSESIAAQSSDGGSTSSASVGRDNSGNAGSQKTAQSGSADKPEAALKTSDSDAYFGELLTFYYPIRLDGSFSSTLSNNAKSSINEMKSKMSHNPAFGNYGNDNFIYNAGVLGMINLPKLSVQFRRVSSQNSYPPVVVSGESNLFTDNSLGVWYHFMEEVSIGLEGGQEMFSQEFTLNNLNYSQAPMLYWAGISARYNPNEMLIPYTLNPYFTQTIAWTKVGPLSRTQVGMTFNVSSPVSIFVGGEYSWLFYNVGGNIYNTGKLGITGGININFR